MMKVRKVELRPTLLADLDFVLAAEQHPDNAETIGHWTRARHEAAIACAEEGHFVVDCAGQRVGYLIVIGLGNPDRSLLLKRVVIVEKGKGYGRQAVQWVKHYAFETLKFHRLRLDVLISNARAKSLYLSEGFTLEGTLRDGYKTADGYESLHILSMLETEYVPKKHVHNQEDIEDMPDLS